jgi:hypothetical protein
MSIYKPTFLYIKQHIVTGKLYFGKTTQNPIKYSGSGKYWLNHIRKHGVDKVETVWYCLFTDKETLTKFALDFSKQNNITESENWANLKPETGLDGGTITRSFESRLKQSKTTRGRTHNKDWVNKISRSLTGKSRGAQTPEQKLKTSIALRGKKKPLCTCPHCGKIGGVNTMHFWHFDKCKFISIP